MHSSASPVYCLEIHQIKELSAHQLQDEVTREREGSRTALLFVPVFAACSNFHGGWVAGRILVEEVGQDTP